MIKNSFPHKFVKDGKSKMHFFFSKHRLRSCLPVGKSNWDVFAHDGHS